MVERAHSTRGTLLRDVAKEALLLFPILDIGPQCSSVSSSSVKTDGTTRLDLWRRGLLDELVIRAKVQARARQRSKTARAARRTTRLIHKQQFARAANLAGNLGIANAIVETLESMRHFSRNKPGFLKRTYWIATDRQPLLTRTHRMSALHRKPSGLV